MDEGCTRRLFLKSGGIALVSFAAGSLGGGPLFLQRAALAATPRGGRRKVLVAIFQRGAMDGLMAVPPLDAELARLRPRLGMSAARSAGEERLLDLGVGFGLHPGFSPLLPLWRDGRLAVVQAVGSPDPTRSHFDAQDYMETATPGRKGTSSGWLNRVAGELGHDATPLRAVSLTPELPRSLAGPAPAVAVADLDRFAVGGAGGDAAVAGFEALYGGAGPELLRTTGRETFEALQLVAAARRGDDGRPPGRSTRARRSAGRWRRSPSWSRPVSAWRSLSPRAQAGTPTCSRELPRGPSPAARATSPPRWPHSGTTSAPCRTTWRCSP